MINRIRSALAARRRAVREAEALVWHLGERAEAVALSRVRSKSADNRTGHISGGWHGSRRRHDLLNGLDTAARYTEMARWRDWAGTLIR
jgi:hypothetical protein